MFLYIFLIPSRSNLLLSKIKIRPPVGLTGAPRSTCRSCENFSTSRRCTWMIWHFALPGDWLAWFGSRGWRCFGERRGNKPAAVGCGEAASDQIMLAQHRDLSGERSHTVCLDGQMWVIRQGTISPLMLLVHRIVCTIASLVSDCGMWVPRIDICCSSEWSQFIGGIRQWGASSSFSAIQGDSNATSPDLGSSDTNLSLAADNRLLRRGSDLTCCRWRQFVVLGTHDSGDRAGRHGYAANRVGLRRDATCSVHFVSI